MLLFIQQNLIPIVVVLGVLMIFLPQLNRRRRRHRAMNFGVDLSHEAKTAAVESTDPNIGAILTPRKPDPIDTTIPAVIVGGAILLGFVLIARSRCSEEE